MIDLFDEIKNYKPINQQEEHDKEQMFQYMMSNTNYLERENQIAHFTASIWTINKEHTKTLMAYRVYCWHKRRESYEHLGESKRRITDHE